MDSIPIREFFSLSHPRDKWTFHLYHFHISAAVCFLNFFATLTLFCVTDALFVHQSYIVVEFTFLYLDMELAVDSLTLVIHHFKGVTSISIHVLIAVRNAAITE